MCCASQVPHIGTEPHLGFERLDAENDELIAPQPLREALVIELMFMRAEGEQLIALVGNPLPGTLGPKVGQIPLKGAQGLLPHVRLLL
jgi:hypothetical protein